MIFKEGWQPVRDLYFAGITIANHLTDPTRPDAADEMQHTEMLYNTMRTIATKLPRFGILLANGEVLEGSGRLLNGVWKGDVTRHVKLTYSTLGSGYILDEIALLDQQAQERELTLRYGPFFGHMVMMRDEDYVAATKSAYPWVTELLPPGREQIAAMEQLIDEKSSRGPGRPPLRDGEIAKVVLHEFRSRYPNGLPRRGMEAVYSLAVEWVKERFGDEISLSSARRYLSELRNVRNTENSSG